MNLLFRTRPVPHLHLQTSILLALLALGTPGLAGENRILDATSRTSLGLTLYTARLGLVQETRTLELPAGVHDVELADVADGIDPSTLLINGVAGKPFRVLEQRVERDPLRPQRLLELFVGHEVVLVTRHEDQERRTPATLLSLDGPVYAVDDEIWIRHPGEIVLPALPPGLRPRPAVIWKIEADSGGTRTLETAYLTSDLGWNATYAGRLSGDTLMLQGWADLQNNSSVRFDDAQVRLVAGDVHRVSRPGPLRSPQVSMMAEAREAAPAFQQEPAFEYHVYTLERSVHLPEHSSIQVPLREEVAVAVTKYLTFRGAPYGARRPAPESRNLRPEIHLEAVNPGAPMPAGVLRVYGEEDSGLVFLGEDQFGPTPEGASLRVRLGRAFDVQADRTQTDFRAVASGRYDQELAFRIQIRNHKSESVRVRLEEPVPGDWKLLESSAPPVREDAGLLRFEITVPASGQAEVTYRVAVDQG